MKVAVVSTYPPRHCGLATFTSDLRGALREADHTVEVVVAAVLDEEPADPPPEVAVVLRQHERPDYEAAALELNRSGADVVLVQHEYGIFGGEGGEYLLDLTSALDVPYVVTLHTLLEQPTPRQAEVLRRLAAGAAQVTVFTAAARDDVVRQAVAPPDRVSVVHHGAPAELQVRPPASGRARPLNVGGGGSLPELDPHGDRRVLSTFGLLSSVKGLEAAIRALTTVREKHPDVLYVVAGRTHPQVVRTEGERYRDSLRRLTTDLGLQDHVLFLDRYLADDDIRTLLARTEVFLTPYRSQEQVVSGVLTFALVAGCPVVSTPYRYATELLAGGAGRLVAFDDDEAMAEALLELLGDDAALARASRAAHTLGTQYTWPSVGREMLKLLARASEVHERPGSRPAVAAAAPPLPTLDHLERLVDVGGIVQHAVGLEPDRSTGYCVDDVARLLLVADALARRPAACPQLGAMAENSLAFLEEAWCPSTGCMHNLREVGGTWLDPPHHGDHVGRAVWALGEVASGPSPLAPRSRSLLDAVVAAWPADAPPRAVAFAVLGLARSAPRPYAGGGPLRALADELSRRYRRHRRPEWAWFEDELTYDNARLPQALIAAAGPLHDAGLLADGLEALDWYAQRCGLGSGVVVLVGNRWRRRSENPTGHAPANGDRGPGGGEGDEQPLDAAALVEACVEAYHATGAASWGRHALEAYDWFHGANRWRTAVYDDRAGGCHDGVGPDGLNLNEGAESTLAHLQARGALDAVGLTPGGPRR